MSPVSRLQCHNSKACQFQGFAHWGEIVTTRQSAPVQYTEVSARENKSELYSLATFSCNALSEKIDVDLDLRCKMFRGMLSPIN